MRRFLLLATVGALAALAVTATAAAKGPTSASLTGPGLDRAVPIKGEGESGTGTPLGSLVELGGFFPQMFVQTPDSTVRTRPTGDLGPRYRVAYRVPGPSGISTVVQDVYPYAKTPVTYMRPGQRFWGVNHAHGGWFVSGPGLKATLVAAGLPKSPPALPAPSRGSFPWTWAIVGATAFVVLLVLVLRRRSNGRFRTVRSTA
jgi:hypothetical protein